MEPRARTSQIRHHEQVIDRVSAGFILPSPPTAIERKRIQAGEAIDLHDMVTRALAIIDRIHATRSLPKIPIHDSYNDTVPSAGGFVSREDEPVSIDINTFKDFAPTAMLTFFHEIGHFLDHAALGWPGVFATLAGDSLLDGWRRAIESTDAVQALRQRSIAGTVVIETPDGTVEETVGRRHARYLLAPDELWARSYAQYIAEQSMDTILIRALDLTRPPAVIGQIYPAQWRAEDFAPVRQAIDTLFRGQGWLR
jgi:hypothetical protein